MYLCVCKAISEKCVRKAIAAGCESFEAIVKQTGLSQECGNCVCIAEERCDLLLGQMRNSKISVSQSDAA